MTFLTAFQVSPRAVLNCGPVLSFREAGKYLPGFAELFHAALPECRLPLDWIQYSD